MANMRAMAERLSVSLGQEHQPAGIIVSYKRPSKCMPWDPNNLIAWLKYHAADKPYVSLVQILEQAEVFVLHFDASAEYFDGDYSFRNNCRSMEVPMNCADWFIGAASKYCGKNCR